MELYDQESAIHVEMDEIRSDEFLFDLMLQGDRQAFCDLYDRLSPGIYQFALQMSGSPWIAEDVTQDVFVLLIEQKQNRFDPARGPVRPYLYGIARHRIRKAIRKSVREIPAPIENNPRSHQNAADPFTELSRAQVIRLVQKAVLNLPSRYREVVILIELQEMSYLEVSSILHCAVGTIRSRLHRARSLLWERLKRLTLEGQHTSCESGGTEYEISTI